MPRGGKRPGAGRKPGSKNKRTKKVAEKAAAEGITPIEVMLEAMRSLHEGGNLVAAAAVAKDAAPYVHPRLAAVQHSGDPKQPLRVVLAQDLTDEQLAVIALGR